MCMPFGSVDLTGCSGAPVLKKYNDEWTVVGFRCGEVGNCEDGTSTKFVTLITAIIDHIQGIENNISFGK